MSNPASNPIRIVLVDHLTLVRSGLRAILDRFQKVQVVGEASTVQEALSIISLEHPNIVLFNLESTDCAGLESIPMLIDGARGVRLVLLTESTDLTFHQCAAENGAMGIVHESQTPDMLIKAIEKVNDGEVWLDRMTMARVLRKISYQGVEKETDPEEARITTLSAREREIIALAGQGLRNKEIGGRLSISEVTVRHYFTAIFSKLAVSDRLELIIFAYRHRLAQPPQ